MVTKTVDVRPDGSGSIGTVVAWAGGRKLDYETSCFRQPLTTKIKDLGAKSKNIKGSIYIYDIKWVGVNTVLGLLHQ